MNIWIAILAAFLTAVVGLVIFATSKHMEDSKLHDTVIPNQSAQEFQKLDMICVHERDLQDCISTADPSTLIIVYDDSTEVKTITPMYSNCPNCGAPVLREHDCCPYCNTVYLMQSAS